MGLMRRNRRIAPAAEPQGDIGVLCQAVADGGDNRGLRGSSLSGARARQAGRHGQAERAAVGQKPYVPSNKNDERDAEGLCEAASRPRMEYVPVKTAE